MELKEVRISRIKEKMNEHGLNSRELAKRSGISESGISRMLTGEIEPRLKTFIKIADALHCDYVWLMGYDVENKPVNLVIEHELVDGLNTKSIALLRSYADYLRATQNNADQGGTNNE